MAPSHQGATWTHGGDPNSRSSWSSMLYAHPTSVLAFPTGLLHTFLKLRTLHQEVQTLHYRVNEQVPLVDVMSNFTTGLSGKPRSHQGQSGNLRQLLWSLVPLVVQVLTADLSWLLVSLQGSRACSWK